MSTIPHVEIRTGDILAFHIDERISVEEKDELRARCEQMFPGYKIVIMTSGLRLQVIRPVEAEIAGGHVAPNEAREALGLSAI